MAANVVMEQILKRRSVRAFTDQAIDREILEECAKAAIYAPSGMGRQTWQFTVVTEPKQIAQLAAAVAEELQRPDYDMYRPTALIIPSNDKESRFGR
ncbi:MAG: nitroreductase family protein, partial [bacterium]|nr:nitroreductase family protein [bacterium]